MPLLYITGFPSNPISGKGSFFIIIPIRFFSANARLIKFPIHPKSIKALAQENIATFTHTTKLSK